MSRSAQAANVADSVRALLQSNRLDRLRQRLDSGDWEPSAMPEVIYSLAGHPAVDLLDRWLAAGVDPNWESMPRPLAIAVSRGRLANVESLLAAGADPNSEAEFGGGPLHKAVLEGHDAVAVCLLAAGADPNLAPGVDELAIMAAGQGLVETLRALLDAGAAVEARGTYRPAQFGGQQKSQRKTELLGRSIQQTLSAEEAAELDELRAWSQARLEALDGLAPYRDATLLAIAHGEGQDAIVALLLDRGADPATREERVGPEAPHLADDANPFAGLAGLLRDDDDDDPTLDSSIDEDEDEDDEDDEPDLPDLPVLTDGEAKALAYDAVLGRLRTSADSEAFRAATETLESLAGNRAKPWADGAGAAVHVDSRSRGGKMLRGPGVEALQDALAAPHLTLVLCREAAVLLPTADPLEVIAAFGVSAPNVDIRMESILATFRDHPVRLHQVRHDLIVGRVAEPPTDREAARHLALRYLALHPETLYEDQPVEILANQLLKDGEVYLWWD